MTERKADDQMRAHFDQRAAEYDDWWLGTGSFAERERPGWSAEVEQLIGVVRALPPARVLDVACGTGFAPATSAHHFLSRARARTRGGYPPPRRRDDDDGAWSPGKR